MGKSDKPSGNKKKISKEIDHLIQDLGDEDESVRFRAVWELGEMGEAAVGALIEALVSDDWVVREGAAKALVKIGESAVESLIKVLSHGDADGRRRVVWVLGEIGDVRAIEPLIKALTDKDIEVRRYAVGALGDIEDLSVVESLVQALSDDDVYIRRMAAWALGKIGDKKAVKPLIQVLGDDDGGVRRYAVAALGRIGDKRAVKPLISCLDDVDTAVRLVTESVLGRLGDPRAVKPLTKTIGDKDERVGIRAARVLGRIGKPAVESLIQALTDKDDVVRWRAAWSLGMIGDSRAVSPLIEALKDEAWDVRLRAAEALGKIGDERALKPLKKASKDENDYVRRKISETIKEIQPDTWKPRRVTETGSKIVVKPAESFIGLALVFIPIGIIIFLAGISALFTEPILFALEVIIFSLFFILPGIWVLFRNTTIEFDKHTGYVTVTRGHYPVFLWFFRKKRFSKDEISSVRFHKKLAYSQKVNYVLKVKLKTGKEVTIYKDIGTHVGEYLKQRILEFSPEDRKVERIKPPWIKDTGSKIVLKYMRIDQVCISYGFFLSGILILFPGILMVFSGILDLSMGTISAGFILIFIGFLPLWFFLKTDSTKEIVFDQPPGHITLRFHFLPFIFWIYREKRSIPKKEIRTVLIRTHTVRSSKGRLRDADCLYVVMRSGEEVVLYADYNPERVEYVEQRVLEFIAQ